MVRSSTCRKFFEYLCLLTGQPKLDAAAVRKKYDDEAESPLLSAGGKTAFDAAAAAARDLKGASTATRLRLYALYKQATAGDAPSAAPTAGVLDPAAPLKYRAWANVRGMPASAARDQYVHTVRCALNGTADADTAGDAAAADAEQDAVDAAMAEAMNGMAGPVMSAMTMSTEETEALDEADRRQPLHAAARQGNATLCAKLVRAGRAVDELDEDEHTALHWACDGGHAAAAAALLEAGAAVDAQNCDGATPLYMACACESRDVAMLLCRHGASPRVADSDGSTPADVVRANGSADDAEWRFLLDAE